MKVEIKDASPDGLHCYIELFFMTLEEVTEFLLKMQKLYETIGRNKK